MILSEVKQLKNPTITDRQRIIVKCDACQKDWESALFNQKINFIKYHKDLCRGCKQHIQALSGSRDQQYINAGIASSKKMKGKTYEELYSLEKSEKIKSAQSLGSAGENNWNFEGTWPGINPGHAQKGKTKEEIYGDKRGKEIKLQISNSLLGVKNPMYGKPSPKGSGNGWSGWYKGWYFRSLKELSYMVYVIERFNFKWANAEVRKFNIKYIDWKGSSRTYHPDFIIEDKYLVEIKPKKLWNSDNVKRKKDAAIKFCENNNLTYKLIQPVKTISFEDIKLLIAENKLEFINRYKEKFEIWQKQN